MILAYRVELQRDVNIALEKMLHRALFALGLTGIYHHYVGSIVQFSRLIIKQKIWNMRKTLFLVAFELIETWLIDDW